MEQIISRLDVLENAVQNIFETAIPSTLQPKVFHNLIEPLREEIRSYMTCELKSKDEEIEQLRALNNELRKQLGSSQQAAKGRK